MEDLPEAHRNQLLSLFKEHGVAFYFAGHGHTYNRADNASWDDGSTVHIMVGGAGNDETPFPADVRGAEPARTADALPALPPRVAGGLCSPPSARVLRSPLFLRSNSRRHSRGFVSLARRRTRHARSGAPAVPSRK